MENRPGEKNCESCGTSSCSGNCGNCTCPHHKAIPVFIILIAAVFLIGQLGYLDSSAVGFIWPVLLMGIGITKLMKGKCSCC